MDRNTFDNELDELLLRAENLIPTEVLPDLPYMELAPDVHDWYDFEHELETKQNDILIEGLKWKKGYMKQL